MNLKFNRSLEDKVKYGAWLTLSNDLSSLFVEGFSHVILHLIVEILIKVILQVYLVKIVNMLEKGDLEHLPFVFVSRQAVVLHVRQNVWKTIAKIIEPLLPQAGHGAVI